MFTFHHKLPDFNPVNSGVRASLRVPLGYTYREFVLKYTPNGTAANAATMAADIEEVSIKVNGKVRFTVSGKTLLMLNGYYKNGFTDGLLYIPLSRKWARTVAGEENLCWGTRNVESMHLEVKIASTATNPQLTADAFVTPEQRDLGIIVEVHEIPYEAVSAGKKEIPDLPKTNGALAAMHFESALITNLEVILNKTPFIENDADLGAYQDWLSRVSDRELQTGYTHLDALALNRIDDAWALAGLQEFRVNPTVSAAGSIPIIMETISQPLGAATAA